MRPLIVVVATLLLISGAVPAVAAVSSAPPLPVFGAFAGAPPDVTAASWILYDETFDKVLAQHDADERRAMASTTKIMTALVALDLPSLNFPVTVSKRAADIGEAEAGLVEGEVLTMQQLLTAMLVRSGNDAAMAVAEGVAGSVEAFVDMMNAKAVALGLENTHFENPHGLDELGHYTTARDLLTMALVAMQNPLFAQLVRTQTVRLPNAPDGTIRVISTTNQLLSTYDGAIGVKTGYTNAAGHVLVAAAERDGRTLYAVVMGSTDSFADAAALLDYGFSKFGVIDVIMSGATYAQRRVSDTSDPMTAESGVEAFSSLEDPVTVETEFEGNTPVAVARIGGVAVGTSELTGEDAEHLPTLHDALGWISTYWSWLWGR